MSNTRKADAFTKPSYVDLIARRATSNSRRLYKVPLCLQPELYAARDAAREAHKEAFDRAATTKALGGQARVKLSETDHVTSAKRYLEEVEQQIRDVSIVLVVAGRTSDETVRVLQSVPKIDVADDAPADERAQAESDNTFALNRALFMDAYQWAEDLDGERLVDVDRSQIEALLPTLSSGEMNTLVMARNIASSAPDFPTSRRS